MKDVNVYGIISIFILQILILSLIILLFHNIKIKEDNTVNQVYEYYTNIQDLNYNYINDVIYDPKCNEYVIEYNNIITVNVPNSLFNSFIEEYNNDNKTSISDKYVIVQQVLVFDNNNKDISYYLVKANIQRP